MWLGAATLLSRCRVAGLPTVVSLALTTVLAEIGAEAEPTTVELELALAVDVSGSVDHTEFALQVQGLSVAFRHPSVAAAIEATGPAGIAVAVVQWSCPGRQARVVDWTWLRSAADARRLAGRIAAMGRRFAGETSIEFALRFAMRELAANDYNARRSVIDISGDGRSHQGDDTAGVRDRVVAAGITINGLAILNEAPDLDSYYREAVVGGPGSFLMIADDYQDFVTAIRRKLVREIGGPAIASRLSP